MSQLSRRRAGLLLLLPALVLASLGLGGCGDRPARPAGEEAAEEGPRRGGTVVLASNADVGGVNEVTVSSTAVTDEVLFRLFVHLVEEQPDFQRHPPTFAPSLASSFEWSPDHKILTFHLRSDALWSDGVPITAEDVRWTWQVHTDPAIAWTSSYMKESITDVEVVDPHTVRFHFSRVYAKQMLDANEGVILPRHAWSALPFEKWRDNSDWFRDHLVVSGPFKLESWTPQQEMVLVRNERYFERSLPYLDRVVLRTIPEQGNQIAQLLSGQVDFATNLLPRDAERLRADPDLELISLWHRLYVAIVWNSVNPLFSDPEVRRALTLSIDRQALVDTLWGPYARVAVSPIVRGVWAHDDALEPWPYDPAEARRILAAKGWRDSDGDGVLDRDGKRFAFELTTNAGNQPRIDAMAIIQEQLKRVGIRVALRVLEFHTLVQQNNTGQFDATLTGIGMDTSLDLRYGYHSGSIWPGGDNIARYVNPKVDLLIDRAADRADIADAAADLREIQQIIHRDQPLTFLWESQRLTAINRRIRGAQPNALFVLFHLEQWWLRTPS
jgi:peptide/nickel transport system substrate-binding protein